jgi:hypothetical protein
MVDTSAVSITAKKFSLIWVSPVFNHILWRLSEEARVCSGAGLISTFKLEPHASHGCSCPSPKCQGPSPSTPKEAVTQEGAVASFRMEAQTSSLRKQRNSECGCSTHHGWGTEITEMCLCTALEAGNLRLRCWAIQILERTLFRL